MYLQMVHVASSGMDSEVSVSVERQPEFEPYVMGMQVSNCNVFDLAIDKSLLLSGPSIGTGGWERMDSRSICFTLKEIIYHFNFD